MRRGLLALIFALAAPLAYSAEYEVSLENLMSGQTLTPAVVAVHNSEYQLFEVGDAASLGLALLAIDGVRPTLREELAAEENVSQNLEAPRAHPGRTVNLRLSAESGEEISLASMLTNTNDGFVAARNIPLDIPVGESREYDLFVYDAGAEENTESCKHVPGNACRAHNVGPEEMGTIQLHPGILGDADLSVEVHGFEEVGAKLTVRRIN